jgi:farnesyl diphosphate synthase
VIDAYLQRHEQALEAIIVKAQIPAQTMRDAIHYSLFPGGKRIRPVLVYLTGELIDVPLPVLDAIAASIELTHCYSLIHDDLPAMDNDDFRRGKLSCHKAYNEATAILAGDGLQALAIEVLMEQLPSKLPPSQIISITHALVKASGISGMVSGQSLDLTELAQASVTEEQLKTIHQLKTGKLIAACIEMVIAAQEGVDESFKSSLRRFAYHLGLVFQMQDDYLDHYAPANTLGKARSSDAANQKTTFASVLSREQLEQDISLHYQKTADALELFGNKALELIDLVKTLENRSNFS